MIHGEISFPHFLSQMEAPRLSYKKKKTRPEVCFCVHQEPNSHTILNWQ